jgi:hypothetical protein
LMSPLEAKSVLDRNGGDSERRPYLERQSLMNEEEFYKPPGPFDLTCRVDCLGQNSWLQTDTMRSAGPEAYLRYSVLEI